LEKGGHDEIDASCSSILSSPHGLQISKLSTFPVWKWRSWL